VPGHRTTRAAVIALAAALAACALSFGIWASLTHNSALLGRQTDLAGIYSLVLAVILAAVSMIVWARRPATAAPLPAADTGQSPGPPEAPRTIVIGEIPREPLSYQARPELVAALNSGGHGHVTIAHAVTGQRGVGKTQLAAAAARARLIDHWQLVAWINAETAATTLAGLAATAAALDLPPAPDADAAGHAVRHWLEADGTRCLIVYDNAITPADLQPYLPAAGNAQTIITTTNQAAANLGTSVAVDVFTPTEAHAYLSDRTGRPWDPAAADLAHELGYLPLALAQSAAVITTQRLTYDTYLQRLRDLPIETMLPAVDAGHYPRSAAAAILLSLDAATSGDTDGTRQAIMNLTAVLSPAGTPRTLLHFAAVSLTSARAPDYATPARIDTALGYLANASLLTYSLDDTTVTAHRLVMRVIRDRLAQQGYLPAACLATARILDAAADPLMGDAWKDADFARDLIIQILALATHAPRPPGDELATILRTLRFRAAFLLNQLRDDPALAISIAEPLISEYQQALGPRDSQTLACRNTLAVAYHAARRYADAISLYEQTLADAKDVYGPRHPNTLASRNNLADAYQATGRHDEAIELHRQNLTDREELLGPRHRHTLDSRNNLAAAYHVADQLAEASALYEQTLAEREEILGPRHPQTLDSRNNLALVYQGLGRYDEAVELHKQTVTDSEEILGPGHPLTLESRINLADAYSTVGRYDKAVVLYQSVLAESDLALDSDHGATEEIRNKLAAAQAQLR
jgi:tetratricopeptide (TPR) repeat protein